MSPELMTLWELAITFAKMGALIFGGGLVIVALIEDEIVIGQQWLTHKEFLDGLALGQVTPGPITILATFVGYKVAGIGGALVATIAIYAPGILLVILTTRYFQRVRHSRWVRAFLNGVKPAAVAVLVAVSLRLATTMIQEPLSVLLALAALGILLFSKIEAWMLILVGALIGLLWR
ncbi:MAG: chromate transporter [Chloroflexi bacterium]|nr:chromate transporter [Chloroflexota bacterium]